MVQDLKKKLVMLRLKKRTPETVKRMKEIKKEICIRYQKNGK